jgi:hypothetical protein
MTTVNYSVEGPCFSSCRGLEGRRRTKRDKDTRALSLLYPAGHNAHKRGPARAEETEKERGSAVCQCTTRHRKAFLQPTPAEAALARFHEPARESRRPRQKRREDCLAFPDVTEKRQWDRRKLRAARLQKQDAHVLRCLSFSLSRALFRLYDIRFTNPAWLPPFCFFYHTNTTMRTWQVTENHLPGLPSHH